MNKILRSTMVAALAFVCATTFAQTTVTFTASSDKGTYTSLPKTGGQNDEVSKEGITISSDKGAFGVGTHYRIGKSGVLTISSTVGNITKVVFTCTASGTTKYGPGSFAASSVSTGTYVAGTDNVGTWTGNAASFTITASNNQVRATKIEVTYTADANAVTPPTISGTNPFAGSTTVTIDGGGNTVYYTLDGTTPTTASTQYTAAFTLSETTTVKAIAYKDGKASEVTTKEFKKMPATVGAGTVASPYSVADAHTLGNAGTLPSDEVYFTGTIHYVQKWQTGYTDLSYSIVDDATNSSDTLLVYRGKGLNGADLTADGIIKVGDKVVVKGKLVLFGNTTLEVAQGSSISDLTSGINGVKADEKEIDKNAPIYNLAGQRVDKDYKGVVIQDGHKFIQK